jgi:hypothetical protein
MVTFTLSVYDDLAEIVDAFERADDVVARQLLVKLHGRVEFIVVDTGWLASREAEVTG